MKLRVLANLYGAKPPDDALKIISGLGVHTVEIGANFDPSTLSGRVWTPLRLSVS